ncbi:MAG: S4 domain-containing protein [Bacilli bacterium]|nr:RNA-binding S4 domain-containing protein [Erysipelotrichaceae bacterium]MDY5668845.1 S4 domain-containing protein [Bacilli bacterium]
MRLDKYLKVSRIIKRRSVAKEVIDNGFVFINEKKAKASSEIKIGDTISLLYRDEKKKYIVKNIFEFATEEKAKSMYEEIN